MPRQSRIDAPGALHHIICRGIEQRRIFENDEDRDNFIKRLGGILSETQTPCYAANRAVQRGRSIAKESGLNLEIAINA